MKKKLVFTHGIDIDGYGCAILAKLAWGENVEIVYADNFDLDTKFIKFALGIDLNAEDLNSNPERYAKLLNESERLEKYDQIFVTDHCLGMALCKAIDMTKSTMKNKIQIFDHHASRVGNQDQFPWVNIVVEKNGEKECGTSLFYEYLVENKYILRNSSLDEWSNLTRLYDTWEWTKISEKRADRLNTFSLAVGRENYVNTLLDNFHDRWSNWFGVEENKVVDKYIIFFNEEVEKYVSKIQVINFAGAKAGYVKILDIFKNDIAEQVRKTELAKEIDFMLMPVEDRESISLRNVKPDFDVSAVAAQFGGGGHKGAASFPKQNMPKIELKNKEL